MLLSKLEISSFRNFTQASLDFDPHINVILGPNGAGKTHLLEAVFFCAPGAPLLPPVKPI